MRQHTVQVNKMGTSNSQASRGTKPLPKNNHGNKYQCTSVHPIGSFEVKDWHSCLFCPPELCRLPGLWHLDHSTGILQPPGWFAQQEALQQTKDANACVAIGEKLKNGKKRGHSVCSMIKRVKRWCFSQPPQTPNVVLQEDQSEGEEGTNVKNPHSEEPMGPRECSPLDANIRLPAIHRDSLQNDRSTSTSDFLPSSDARLIEELTSVKKQLFDQQHEKQLMIAAHTKDSSDQLTIIAHLTSENDHLRTQIAARNDEISQLNGLLSQQVNVAEATTADKFTNFRRRLSFMADIEDDRIDQYLLTLDDQDLDKAAENVSDSIDVLTSKFAGLFISDNDALLPGVPPASEAEESSFAEDLDSDDSSEDDGSVRRRLLSPIETRPSSPAPVQISLDLIWMGPSALRRLRLEDLASIPRRLLIGISNGMPRSQIASHLDVLLICLQEALNTFHFNLDDVNTLGRSVTTVRRLQSSVRNNGYQLNYGSLQQLLLRIMTLFDKLE